LLPRDIPLPDRGQQLFIAAPNQGHECILRLTTMEASRRILLGIPLNLNTDDAQSLAAIPGLSLRIALRIVEHRQHKGAFRHWEDLLAVRGIGPKTLHKIRPYLVLEEQHNQTDSNQGGLNTAFELSSNSTSFVKFKCSGKKPKNEVKSGQLSIHLNGFASDRGHALLALHTSERHFPHNYKAAYNYQKLSITKRTAQVTIKDLPYGVYAIVAFHDANDNGKLDTNLFGVPTEAYGTSNNARRRFGPPRFRDARFKFRTAHHKISIHLR
jgi:competence ComEA-like helix-hairpin-helix protein